MSDAFVEGFRRGCVLGCAVFGVMSAIVCITLSGTGYTLTRQPPEPVLVPIDCKVVA